jgi:hypothetical protein
MLDLVTGKQGRGWLGLVWGFLFLSRSCRMYKKKCVFYGLIVMKLVGFSVSIFYCDEEMKKKTGYGKKN